MIMNKISVCLSLVVFGLCMVSIAWAEEKVSWDYSETGPEGPRYWGELDSKFSICSTGKNQSPVDLTGMVESDLSFITINYQAGGNEILNNGHTIQVNYKPGSTISVNGQEFELKQFHFHSPSENKIRGESMPMEAHFVHADMDGNLAVIALMFRVGDENTELEKAWAFLPVNAGDKNTLSESVNANYLLPDDLDYYRFNGSLTTPPCSEGVLWLVLKNYDVASVEQIHKFTQAMRHPNNRPIQPKNSRLIMK